MKIDRVVLNPSQAAWFARNVLKMLTLLEASEKKNKGVKNRTTYKTLATLKSRAEEAAATIEAFGEDEEFVFEFTMGRKQRAVLKDLVGSVHKGLIEKVIPEYKRRGDSHAEYLERATEKAKFLEALWRKFK